MLHTTRGIVLRTIKYGESSLVCTILTAVYGVQTYMVQGVRSSKSRHNKAALLQPSSLLDMVVYHKPQAGMQRIKEYQLAYVYQQLQQDVVRNSIALFSTELLLRLLPEHAPFPELFDLSFYYFQQLDKKEHEAIANFPLYFIVQCSRLMGYEIRGTYTAETPHLDVQEGGFTHNNPVIAPYVYDSDAAMLAVLLKIRDTDALHMVNMNASMRFRLLDWYVAFLQRHTQHMGNIKSLPVLQAILH